MQNIGLRLSKAIKKQIPKGMTAKPTAELSGKLGIGLTRLSRIINGTARNPTYDEMNVISRHFGIDLQDLNQETSCEKD